MLLMLLRIGWEPDLGTAIQESDELSFVLIVVWTLLDAKVLFFSGNISSPFFDCDMIVVWTLLDAKVLFFSGNLSSPFFDWDITALKGSSTIRVNKDSIIFYA
jgi:hypothetical protein